MFRGVSLFLVFVTILMPLELLAQSMPSRLPTQTGQGFSVPTPSFRGGPQNQNLGNQGNQQPFDGLNPMGAASMMEGSAAMGAGYQVHVLGEVRQPGTYYVQASSRLAEAVQRAGGIAENGSARRIELRRKHGGAIKIDLLKFRMSGSLENNPYLMDNDVVFVPLRENVVRVVGAVKRPETYELKDEKKLVDAIDLAGGFNMAIALKEPIRIVRYVDGEKKLIEVENDTQVISEFGVQSGDVIIIPNMITKDTKFDYNVASIPGDQVFYPSYEDRVFILGGVASPGAYSFTPYHTINQYVSLAGGLTDRGVSKYKIIGADGKSRRAKESDKVNPGETVMVKQRAMTAVNWTAFAMSFASFGLAASSTVIALTR